MKLLAGLLATSLAVFTGRGACAGETLDRVRAAGTLTCALVRDADDWSEADTHGDLSAFGADFCRALAAEVFGDPAKASFLLLPDEPAGLAAVRDGMADVLFGATPEPVTGGIFHAAFGPPYFFDGQGFLVRKDGGISGIADLSKRHVCFINNSRAERTLYDALDPVLAEPEVHFPYSERGEMEAALVGGHCDAITGDISWLANVRSQLHAETPRFTVLTDTISLDPIAPAYRAGDPQWAALVSWTIWASLAAEEHAVTRANAGDLGESRDPVVLRLIGATPWIGKALGIADDAFLRVIKAVGNYGELYERDVGEGSKLQLPRGRNRLPSEGGLLWTLPVEPPP
ncbi:MAG: transporter substrate-binding domain-containing protein [Acetobacteraceae bacterium]|nr:transporter substrate-binding domain-containing protein [Acetobacteraceae bacterium]